MRQHDQVRGGNPRLDALGSNVRERHVPFPGAVGKQRHFSSAGSGAMLDRMTAPLLLRRHLYERMAETGRLSRERRAFRRQIALLSRSDAGPDDGLAGVREPRRPSPAFDPSRQHRADC